jgi:agmatine deiminase
MCQIGARILAALNASRILWVEGLRGEDITDGHIDSLARFVGTHTILIEYPAYADSTDPWYQLAVTTHVRANESHAVDVASRRVRSTARTPPPALSYCHGSDDD